MTEIKPNIKYISRVRLETPDRALAMVKAAKKVGLVATTVPSTAPGAEGTHVALTGQIDAIEGLGPFYDEANAVLRGHPLDEQPNTGHAPRPLRLRTPSSDTI